MGESKNTKTRVGTVVSNMMDKSVVVECERIVRHQTYGKFIRRKNKFMADDPQNSCSIGDRVLIEECRPLSKRKRWRLREILEKAI